MKWDPSLDLFLPITRHMARKCEGLALFGQLIIRPTAVLYLVLAVVRARKTSCKDSVLKDLSAGMGLQNAAMTYRDAAHLDRVCAGHTSSSAGGMSGQEQHCAPCWTHHYRPGLACVFLPEWDSIINP